MDQPNSPPFTPRKLPANVQLLGWASFWNDVASEMVFPLLPQFLLSVLGGNRLWLGIIEGFADAASSVLKLWSGGKSDQISRRKGFVVFGYTLAAVARPVVGATTAPWQLFLLRSADRVGKGVRTPPRDAMIADSTTAELRGRAFGFQRGMDHLGAAIGPLLAAAFLWFFPGELRWLFLLTLPPGLIVAGLVTLGLRETSATSESNPNPVTGDRPSDRRWTLRSFDRGFRLYLLCVVVFTLGNATDAFLLVRAGELGVATAWLPVLWCLFHVVKSAGSIIAGRLVDLTGPRPLIFGGWFWYALVYLGFGLAWSAWQAWVLMALYGVFHALTEPAEKTLVANLVSSKRRGLAYGWFNLAIGVSSLPAGIVFGWLYEANEDTAAFGWGALMSLAAMTILCFVPNRPPVASHNE